MFHGICPSFVGFEDRHCTKEELNKMWILIKVISNVFFCMPPTLVERVMELYINGIFVKEMEFIQKNSLQLLQNRRIQH